MKRNRPTALTVSPRLGFPISLALHVAVVVLSLFTWTHKLDIPDQAAPVVPVDLVTLGDKNDIAPMTTHKPEPQDQPQPEDQSQPQPQPQNEPRPQDQAKAQPQAQPQPKPEPAPARPKAKETFDPDRIMALLDKRSGGTAGSRKNVRVGPQNIKGAGAMDAMTADLQTLLRSQIYKCWSPPVGAPNADRLISEFHIMLKRDGSIAAMPQLTATGVPASNPYMRAAAEAARRAIFTCAPYRLPADRYGQWQEVTLVFNPRDMMK